MRKFLRLGCVAMLLTVTMRADEAHRKAMSDVIDGWAKLDQVFLAVHSKKAPIKDLETSLRTAKTEFAAAAQTPGLSRETATEIQACANLFEKSADLMANDEAEEGLKFNRAADDLADLSRLTRTLAGSVSPRDRLTSAERQALWQQAEARFGKKTLEYPRGDTSPFAGNSRSPFASAMWLLLVAFDDSVKR
jgi:hypothetical protein